MKTTGRNGNSGGSTQVPTPTLRRLPGYLSYFKALNISGVQYVSSSQIASVFKMDSTLVSKDLSYTGVRGRTKVGYQVPKLIETIMSFLDFNARESAFIFGVGNLGRALINYDGLQQYGLQIVAGFDTNLKLANTTIHGVKIHALDDFRDLSQKHVVRIAIITTSGESAQDVADLAVAWGIKALWNFTPQSIKAPDNIIVENTSVYSDLAVILNKLNR